jgi:hypothetical protein
VNYSYHMLHYLVLLQIISTHICAYFLDKTAWVMNEVMFFSVFDCRKLLTRVLRSVTPRSFIFPSLRHLLSFTA